MATCTVDGWRSRQGATWYPSSGFKAIGTSTGASLFIASNPSGNNKYTLCVRIKTPNDAGIASISKVSVSFKIYKANNNAGTLYGSLRTTYADSGSGDTASTFRTNAIGSEASSTYHSTSWTTLTFDFSGTFAKNTYYYLFLYTKSNSDMYYTTATNFAPSATCTTTATTYKITYNANGHGTAPSATTKTHGTAVNLAAFIAATTENGYTVAYNANGGKTTPSTQTAKATFTQTKWNTEADGSGTGYASGASYTTNASDTLYAIWSRTNKSITVSAAISKDSDTDEFTVSYNGNGGTAPSNQTLTRTTPYTFDKWHLDSATGTTTVAAGGSFTPSKNSTLYAGWNTGTTTGSVNVAAAITRSNGSSNGFTVSFDANGGSCDTASLTQENTIKYTFKEWSGNDGNTYAAGASYAKSADLTLTAQWNSTTTPGSIDLPTPTKEGYSFAGWSASSSATSGTTGSYTPEEDITLYAIWQQNNSTIAYNHQGSKVMCNVYFNVNGNAVLCNVYYNDNGTAVKI